MLSAEQNDLITRSGPGSPAGLLMRRYWQPAALVEELAGNRPVKPVRLFGENLVMFKDENGQYGLLERHCPHRGTDLAFGRLEDGGLRCAFHGWLFGVDGQCLETPAEPDGSPLCANVRAEGLSGGGAERDSVDLYGTGRAAGDAASRLLCRAGQPHLRIQGHDRLQLAAGARGRHRSRRTPRSCIAFSRTKIQPRPTASSSATRRSIPRCPRRRSCATIPRPRSRWSRPNTACALSRCAGSAT